ncbi:MAG: Bug family tripartite tricarboxylate transporter substrate binding protein [Xanthobacteraceae bacterium]
MNRRTIVLPIVIAVLSAAAAQSARGQNYPARQVTLVLPFSPGGSIDLAARVLAQKLTERLGQSFIVENRPGAGTVIAANHVAKSAPDGYTVLIALSPLATNATLRKKLPYDTANDLVPLARIADIPFVLVVHPSLPVKTVPELVKYAKARAGTLSFASSGPGSTLHLAGELLKSMTGIQMTHVPYKGGPPALNDVVAGHVQLVFADPASAVPQIRAGKVRPLGVSSRVRLPVLPEIPPIAEAGLPGFEAVSWSLAVVPAHTPAPVLDTLNGALKAIVAMPDVQQQFIKFGMIPRTTPSPQELQGFLKSEIARWGKLVQQAGIAGSQ